MTKHRFTENHTAEIDAIQAARQTSVDPCFNAMGLSLAVQLTVGLNHLFHNPGARLTAPWLAGASPDHLVEAVIHPDFAVWVG